MERPNSDLTAMEVSVVANQVQTLHFKLHACALLAPTAAVDAARTEPDGACGAQTGDIPGQTLREGAAVPYAAASVGGSRQHHAAGASAIEAPPVMITSSAMWSSAVRALREKTADAVQAQVARLIEATGRDWEVRQIEFGAPRSDCATADTAGAAGDTREAGAGSRPGARITLVTQVILMARTPTLH